MNLTMSEMSFLVALASAYCYLKLDSYHLVFIINSLWILSLIYATYRYSYWKLQKVAGPSYLPFCKDFTEAIISKDMKSHMRYSRWVGKYGKVFGCFGGSNPILAIADAALAKEVLNFNNDFTETKEREVVKPRCGEFRLCHMQFASRNGEKFRLFRRFVAPFFTDKSFGKFIPLINGNCSDLVSCLDEKATFGDETFVTCSRRLLAEWMVKGFCSIFTPFPSELLEIALEDCDNSNVMNTRTANIQNMSPLLYQILSLGGLIDHISAPKLKMFEKLKFFEQQCQRNYSNESDVSDKKQNQDYLTMCRLRKKLMIENPRKDQYLPTEDEIFAPLFTLLNPIQITNTLCVLLYELANNPDIQHQCRSEALLIDSFDALYSYDAIVRNIPLILASLNESLRLHPFHRQLIRYVHNDVMLNGIQLTKGCIVSILIPDIMRDKALYSEPDAFIPQRFFDRSVNEYKKEGGYLAFGMGERRCMGEKLSTMMIGLLTAHVLRNFDIRFDYPGQQLNEDYRDSSITIDREFKLKLKKLAANN